MTLIKGIDDCVVHLTDKVALAGPFGLSHARITEYVKAFYNDNADDRQSSSPPLLDQQLRPRQIDRAFVKFLVAAVLRQPGIEHGTSATSLPSASPTANYDHDPVHERTDEEQRVFATKSLMWHALTNHGPDSSRIRQLDFLLLSLIASFGPNGILQHELVQISGQDKRSLPQRTDRLAENGYIKKVRMLCPSKGKDGSDRNLHTSHCVLSRFAGSQKYFAELARLDQESHKPSRKKRKPNQRKELTRNRSPDISLQDALIAQWRMEIPLSKQVFNIIHESGDAGITLPQLSAKLLGVQYRKPIEILSGRLVDAWQLSQPLRLRHLAIVRDTLLIGKSPVYVQITFKNFKQLVEEGQRKWQDVLTISEEYVLDAERSACVDARLAPELQEFPKIDQSRMCMEGITERRLEAKKCSSLPKFPDHHDYSRHAILPQADLESGKDVGPARAQTRISASLPDPTIPEGSSGRVMEGRRPNQTMKRDNYTNGTSPRKFKSRPSQHFKTLATSNQRAPDRVTKSPSADHALLPKSGIFCHNKHIILKFNKLKMKFARVVNFFDSGEKSVPTKIDKLQDSGSRSIQIFRSEINAASSILDLAHDQHESRSTEIDGSERKISSPISEEHNHHDSVKTCSNFKNVKVERIGRTGGTTSTIRQSIILSLVRKAGGLSPGPREMTLPFGAEWARRGQKGVPETNTIRTAVNRLCALGLLQSRNFAYHDHRGLQKLATYLKTPELDETDDRVKQLQHDLMQVPPGRLHIPKAWIELCGQNANSPEDEPILNSGGRHELENQGISVSDKDQSSEHRGAWSMERNEENRIFGDYGNVPVNSACETGEDTLLCYPLSAQRLRQSPLSSHTSLMTDNFEPKRRSLSPDLTNLVTRDELHAQNLALGYPPSSDQEDMNLGDKTSAFVLTILIRCLVGASNSAKAFAIMERLFHTAEQSETWQDTWRRVYEINKVEILNYESSFRLKFANAYKTGRLPILRTSDPIEYPWNALLSWALSQTDVPQALQITLQDDENITSRARAPKVMKMTAEDGSQLSEQYLTTQLRERALNQRSWNKAIHAAEEPSSSSTSTETTAQNFVRANIATPQQNYDSRRARDFLSSLSEQDILNATNFLIKHKVLSAIRTNSSGRRYELNEITMQRLRRAIPVSTFQRAASFKIRLDSELRQHSFFQYPPFAEDGDVLAILNLSKFGQIELIATEIPDNKFGYTDGDYQTRQMDKTKLFCNVQLKATSQFKYGNSLASHPKYSLPPGRPLFSAETKALFPLWYDIHGLLIKHIWQEVLACVLSILAFNPGMDAEQMADLLSPALGLWELRLLLSWLVDIQAIQEIRNDHHSGFFPMANFWLALG